MEILNKFILITKMTISKIVIVIVKEEGND